MSAWKLDPNSLKFLLNNMTYDRILPYAKDISGPQKDLLKHILRSVPTKDSRPTGIDAAVF